MIKVVLAFNDNYIKPAATLITSIMANTKSNVTFYVLCTDINRYGAAKLTRMCLSLGCDINFLDIKKTINSIDLNKYMSVRDDYKYISVETYYRFFIPQIFDKDSKILYLDVDMVIEEDINKLWMNDIANSYAGVVQDAYSEMHLKNKNVSPYKGLTFRDYYKNKLKKKELTYFNAGVMLLNLDLMRKDKIDKKLWQFVAKESPLPFQDQDAMNAVMECKLKYLDNKWNIFPQFPIKNPAIIHYVGSSKPHECGLQGKYFDNYWKYAKKTPFFSKEDKLLLENTNTEKPEWVKNFKILGKKFLKIRKYQKTLKVKIFNRLFVFGEEDKFKKHLRVNNAQRRIDKLAKKYKYKNIVIYCAGIFADTIFKYYDLSKLNIVAVSDKRFTNNNEKFYGIRCVNPLQLRNMDYDVILTCIINYDVSDYLEDEILEGSKNEDVEIKRFL